MAANGITVKPVRMGDLMSSGTPTAAKAGGKYTPPSKRVGLDGKIVPLVENIDMSVKNFPSLGAAPAKVPSWGRHVVVAPLPKTGAAAMTEAAPMTDAASVPKETLSDKIKERMRLDALAENGRLSLDETDPWKMTDEQLNQAGWTLLRLSSAEDICRRGFSNHDDVSLPGFITEADTGMSFEEYCHYKGIYDPVSVIIPHTNTPCVINEDDGYYSD
jgi:hypothetical protein